MRWLPIAALAIAVLVATTSAEGDPEREADRAFRAATERAATAPLTTDVLDAFEQLGAARPVTRWTDDAWAEAARLAERMGDLSRARRDLEELVSVGTDGALLRRARADLARLSAVTGDGAWDAVVAQHERLVSRIAAGGDPRAALRGLEELVRANPGYPRAAAIRATLARGWEEEGERDRALRWIREAIAASPADPLARYVLVRTLIRGGALAAARAELARARSLARGDSVVLDEIGGELARAEHRGWIHVVVWCWIAIVALAFVARLRADTGTWRAAVRRLGRPPVEALYLLPITALLVVIAHTGNPLVAGAVQWIAGAGFAISWLSGASLDAARAHGPVRRRRLGVQAVLAVSVALAAAYLAVDRGGVMHLLVETWRGGHALR